VPVLATSPPPPQLPAAIRLYSSDHQPPVPDHEHRSATPTRQSSLPPAAKPPPTVGIFSHPRDSATASTRSDPAAVTLHKQPIALVEHSPRLSRLSLHSAAPASRTSITTAAAAATRNSCSHQPLGNAHVARHAPSRFRSRRTGKQSTRQPFSGRSKRAQLLQAFPRPEEQSAAASFGPF
jgi:hypothetical protein